MMIENWVKTENFTKLPFFFVIFVFIEIQKIDMEALFFEILKIPTYKI